MILKKTLKPLTTIISLTILSISFSTLILSEYFFIFDLFSHFQLQYILLLIIIAIISVFYKNFTIALISTIYSVSVLMSLILPANFTSKELNPDIFYMNTYYYTEKHEQIIKEILNNSADIVFLVEANKSLINDLKLQFGDATLEINDGPNSFVLFSKTKPDIVQIHNETPPKFITAKFKDYTFIGIHAFDPLTPYKRKINLKYFSQIKDYIDKLSGEKFILVGDFNNTIYSGTFRSNFSEYFKINNYSWGAFKPWFIPIDHALANFPLEISITKSLESDHKGLLIKTKLKD